VLLLSFKTPVESRRLDRNHSWNNYAAILLTADRSLIINLIIRLYNILVKIAALSLSLSLCRWSCIIYALTIRPSIHLRSRSDILSVYNMRSVIAVRLGLLVCYLLMTKRWQHFVCASMIQLSKAIRPCGFSCLFFIIDDYRLRRIASKDFLVFQFVFNFFYYSVTSVLLTKLAVSQFLSVNQCYRHKNTVSY